MKKKISLALVASMLLAIVPAFAINAAAAEAAADPNKYEAEDFAADGVETRTSDEGLVSVWGLDSGANPINFTVNAAEAGKYELNVAYVCGMERWIRVTVNDGEPVDATLAAGGSWGTGAGVTSTEYAIKVDLNKGENTIVVNGQPDQFGPGIDYIRLAAIDPNKYQAEDGVLTSDPEREAAGEGVRILGSTVGYLGMGNTLTLTVNAETAGKKTLTIVNTSANLGRSLEITVNGSETPIVLAVNEAEAVTEVELKAGENTIVLGNATAWAPDIDYIVLADVVDDGNGDGDGTGNGNAGTGNAGSGNAGNGDADNDNAAVAGGDATMFAVVAAVVALAGVAVVSKKRHTAE